LDKRSYKQSLSTSKQQQLISDNLPYWICTSIKCSKVFITRSALERHRNEEHKISKYTLACSNGARLKQRVEASSSQDAWNDLLNLPLQDFDAGIPPPHGSEDPNYGGPLRIVGFVKVGHSKLNIDVLVSHGGQRRLDQMMHGKYGQYLLADFFGVDVPGLRSLVQKSAGERALAPSIDLWLMVEAHGFCITGCTADIVIGVKDLGENDTGQQLLRDNWAVLKRDASMSDYVAMREVAQAWAETDLGIGRDNWSRGCLGWLRNSWAGLLERITAFLERFSNASRGVGELPETAAGRQLVADNKDDSQASRGRFGGILSWLGVTWKTPLTSVIGFSTKRYASELV